MPRLRALAIDWDVLASNGSLVPSIASPTCGQLLARNATNLAQASVQGLALGASSLPKTRGDCGTGDPAFLDTLVGRERGHFNSSHFVLGNKTNALFNQSFSVRALNLSLEFILGRFRTQMRRCSCSGPPRRTASMRTSSWSSGYAFNPVDMASVATMVRNPL